MRNLELAGGTERLLGMTVPEPREDQSTRMGSYPKTSTMHRCLVMVLMVMASGLFMACHRSVETKDPVGAKKISAFCFQCHDDGKRREGTSGSNFMPTMDVEEYASATHAEMSCLLCHPKSMQFGHAGQERTACLSCHQRHDEKVTHDAHLRVSCEACHLASITPVKAPESGKITWQTDHEPDKPSDVHHMSLDDEKSSCKRCHYSGNELGASAMILPPKSILCMPCHPATLSVGDTVTLISLFLFLIGLVGLMAVWLSASLSIPGVTILETGEDRADSSLHRRAFPSRILCVLEVMALDVFLQRRLFRQSRTRWFIHGLIFFPFVFRFLWGMTALLGSLLEPESSVPWLLLDKDHPLNALLFDMSGMLILLGVVFTTVRRVTARSRNIAGLPKQDWLALCLIGGTVLIGFVLEGMRIAMAGNPPGSEYSFLGYPLSLLFTDTRALTDYYGYIWYLHAITTGAFVAYLPFSHLFHIIMAPVVMAMNAMSRPLEHEEKRIS